MRARRQLIARLSIILLGTLAGAGPAHANDVGGQAGASPSPDKPGIDISVTNSSDSPGKAGGGGPSRPITCVDFLLGIVDDPPIPDPGSLGGTDVGVGIPPATPGTLVYRTCMYSDNTLVSQGVTFVPAGGPGEPGELLQQARNHLDLPPPPVQLSPAASHWQYVQMPTWAWVPRDRWKPLTASASAGPVTVTVTATPVRLVFSYQISGDGRSSSALCAGPGTPYSDGLAVTESPKLPILAASPDCGWTWHQSSADTSDEKYAVSARAVYHVVWSVRGAAGGGDLGELTGRSNDFRVTVGEIQALNIPPR